MIEMWMRVKVSLGALQRLQPDYDPEQLGRNGLAKAHDMSNCPTDDSRLADAKKQASSNVKKILKLKTNENHEARAAIGWAQVLCR